MQLTRRRLIVGMGLAVGLVGAALALREARYLAHLPPPVRARMPAHFRIPSGLAPEVRAGIEGCYARLSDDRLQAAHNLGNLGPAAAPAVPWLMALLADEGPVLIGPGSNVVANPTPLSINWSACEDWPLIGHLIRLLRERKDDQYRPDSAPEACAALAEIGPAAVEPLIKCLKDDLPQVRANAAVALGNIADPRAIEPLANLLNDDDCELRVAVALALGQLREAGAVGHLTETLFDKREERNEIEFRASAAGGLFKIGPLGWPSIVEALKAEDRQVRCAAAMGVAQYCKRRERAACRNASDLVAALVTALGEPDEDVAAWAARALGRLNEPSAADELAVAARRSSDQVRLRALHALATLGGQRAADSLAAAVKDPGGRPGVAFALAELGDPRAVPPLLDLIEGPPSSAVWLRGHEEAPYDVDRAASHLAQLRDARAIPALALACRCWPDSAAIRASLVSFGAAAVGPLLGALREEEGPLGPIRALAELGDRRAVAPLRAILGDKDPLASMEAAVALARLGDSQAMDGALRALHHPDTRLATVKALGRLGDKRAIGPLRGLLAWDTSAEEEEKGDDAAADTIGMGELRTAILQSLIHLGDLEAIVPALEEAVGDGPTVRGNAVRPMLHVWEDSIALIPRMGKPAVGPLRNALSHPWPGVRAGAACLLLLVDGPEARDALRTTFSIQDIAFTFVFLCGLYREKAAAETETLLEVIAWHKDRNARCWAAEALSKNRDPRVIPALRRVAAEDICPSVRAAAWEALEDLTGEDRPAGVPPQWMDAYNPLGTILGGE